MAADSLRVLPASEAFPGSLLVAPSYPSDEPVRALTEWSDAPLNCILIIVFTMLTLLYLRRLVSILPYLLSGIARWRGLLNIEASVRLSRDRTAFALVMVVPFCLVISRYDLYPVIWPPEADPGIRTCMIIGIFTAYALLRQLLIRIGGSARVSRDFWRIANDSAYSFFIVMTLLVVITAGLHAFFGVNNLIVRKILIYEIAVVFALFLVRKTQILRNACNQFTAFLYLCGLEIFPASLLVISAMLF